MIPTIIAAALLVLAFELIAWWLFRRKLAGLSFPPNADGSDLPLFTVQRLRLIALLHTIVMIVVCVLVLLFLW